jgi:hypothetical protein
MDKEDSKLSKKTMHDIKEARERISDSEIYTEEEAKKILNLLKKKKPRINND